MAETVTNERSPVASRQRSRKPATVSASALALHLDCSRAYIGKLEAEGVIQRQGDGFPLDRSRVAYLRFLRREHKRSPRTEACPRRGQDRDVAIAPDEGEERTCAPGGR
jgi:hypothetical protein